MTTPFQPNEGDTVEFYNSEAELWEPGTVSSYAADRRLYFVQPDDESQSGWLVNHTNIRPLTEPEPAVPSFWEAAKTFCRTARVSCDLANDLERQIAQLKERQNSIADERDNWMANSIANHEATKKVELDRDYWKNRAEITHLQHVAANKRADEAEADRDGWVKEAADNQYISRIGYEERDQARADLRQVSSDLLVAEHRLSEEVIRADGAEARIEELEDQNRVLKSDLEHARSAGQTLLRRSRSLQAEGCRLQDTLQEAEDRATAAERHAAEAETKAAQYGHELDELKAALRTLAGESK